jgi:SAM-dependent methyltransferase
LGTDIAVGVGTRKLVQPQHSLQHAPHSRTHWAIRLRLCSPTTFASTSSVNTWAAHYRWPRLALPPGAVVLELGCGTSTSFPALVAVIGSHGRVIGLDASRAMLAVARSLLVRDEPCPGNEASVAGRPAFCYTRAISYPTTIQEG